MIRHGDHLRVVSCVLRRAAPYADAWVKTGAKRRPTYTGVEAYHNRVWAYLWNAVKGAMGDESSDRSKCFGHTGPESGVAGCDAHTHQWRRGRDRRS